MKDQKDQSVLPILSEQEATGRVAEIYEDIRRGFQLDFVPNFFKAQATRPDLLAGTWNVIHATLIAGEELPRSIKEMMFVAISRNNKCRYCEAAHLALCKMVGVDAQVRNDLINHLDRLEPARSRVLVQFGIKASLRPVNLVEGDYALLREQGLSDGAIQEAIQMAAIASYANQMADALRVPIDQPFADVLAA